MFNKKLYDENNSLVEETSFTDEEQKNKDLVEQLKTLENDKECLSNQKQLFELAANLLKDGGIKTRIIRQYLPIINKLVNRFLSAMNFYVSFSIDENFQETIKSRGRDDFTYACFSEGERQRLDVAILLTWRTIAMMKNSIHTNLLFIDELLDSSLDQVATENIIELINTEPVLSKSNIFVISHKINMIDKFSEYIKFEKYKNFSRLLP
jgi:ABC-type glutathione transport system ATPase component